VYLLNSVSNMSYHVPAIRRPIFNLYVTVMRCTDQPVNLNCDFLIPAHNRKLYVIFPAVTTLFSNLSCPDKCHEHTGTRDPVIFCFFSLSFGTINEIQYSIYLPSSVNYQTIQFFSFMYLYTAVRHRCPRQFLFHSNS
jgi:hypothetical protein